MRCVERVSLLQGVGGVGGDTWSLESLGRSRCRWERIILKQIWNKLDEVAWNGYMAVNIRVPVGHTSSFSKDKWSPSLGFPTKLYMHFSSPPVSAASPNNHIVLDRITRTVSGERPCHLTLQFLCTFLTVLSEESHIRILLSWGQPLGSNPVRPRESLVHFRLKELTVN